MSRYLKLNPPAVLPASGVTSVSFKAWQRTLIAYLEQDAHTPLFTDGGLYMTWRPRGKNRLRIPQLHDDDSERVAIMDHLTAALAARQARPNDPRIDQYDQQARDRDLEQLLAARNAQLAKFITLISVLCPYTLTNNLDQLSTSLTWIFGYLEQHYHIQKAGAHFLSINDIRFTAGDSYENFYMELHGAFEDTLRKQGETLLFRNNEVLDHDEEMSPTLENTVVLLWLERIDPRLPQKVNTTFAHQMVGNTSLRDLQPIICARIPSLLQELEDTAVNRASLRAVSDIDDIHEEPPLAAAFHTRGRGRGRGRSTLTRGTRSTGKFCRVCFLTNRGSPQSYTSHTIMTCNKLSDRDKQEMVRHAAMTMDDTEDQDSPTLIPGWDDEEIDQ
jgi:hypothetical protein